MKRATGSAFAAILASASLAAAAAPPTEAQLDRLFAATHAERSLEMAASMAPRVMQQSMDEMARSRGMDADERARLQAFAQRATERMKVEMSWDRMKPVVARIYQETLEDEEVESLIAFYESPGGRAMIAKMPLILQKTMTVMQGRMATLMKDMEAAAQETFGAK